MGTAKGPEPVGKEEEQAKSQKDMDSGGQERTRPGGGYQELEKVQSKGQVNTVSVHRTHGARTRARAGTRQLRGPFALLSFLGQGEVAEEGPGPETEGHLVGRGKVEEKGSRP